MSEFHINSNIPQEQIDKLVNHKQIKDGSSILTLNTADVDIWVDTNIKTPKDINDILKQLIKLTIIQGT